MIYAAGRSTELPELGQIRHQFAAKYGEAGVFSLIMSAQEERRRRQRHKNKTCFLGIRSGIKQNVTSSYRLGTPAA